MAAAGGHQNALQGSMLAIQSPLAEIEALIAGANPKVVLANRNSPSQGVLSGPTTAILEIEKICKTRKIRTLRLPVSAAFHSDQINSAVQPFVEVLKQVSINPTAVEVFSNTTAKAYPADPDDARALLGEQLIHPVDFVNEIENLYRCGVRTYVEVGPKSILTGLISTTLQDRQFDAMALDASSGKAYGVADFARVLCRLAALGYPVKLTQWESPLSSNRRSRMQVLLNGTNYKNQMTGNREQNSEDRKQTTEKNEYGSRKAEGGIVKDNNRKVSDPIWEASFSNDPNHRDHHKYQNELNAQYLNVGKSLNNTKNQITKNTFTNRQSDTMKKENHTQSEFIHEAYRVVAEGLKSMQRLQSQTAEAHQKFLDTQAEANRTLQEMMKSTQRLAEGTIGIEAKPHPAESERENRVQTSQALPIVEIVPVSGKIEHDAGPSDTIAAREIKIPTPSPADWNLPLAAANGYARDEKIRESGFENIERGPDRHPGVKTTLLEIVSRLTGYPVDMLGLDMDIEAELGIDSIKRVEILSNLEETIPDFPAVSPEIMGSLKTLGQIVEYMNQSGFGQTAEPRSNDALDAASPTPTATISESADDRPDVIEATMLEVVSQLTGYPVEMLGMDMDIEAELGIDSIKRVEILSTLEEKLPDLPAVSPDMMGALKTLGQIAEFICNGKPQNAAENRSEDTPQNSHTTAEAEPGIPVDDRPINLTAAMLEVVSQLTGYPVEMLGLEMDIEAELGIDSIKRVEILSTLEEKMPDLPAVSPDMIGSLKTLGQIAEYLAHPPTAEIPSQASGNKQPEDLTAVSAKEPASPFISDPPANASEPIPIPRNVVTVVEAPPVSKTTVSISSKKKVFVTEDHTGLSEEIAEELAKLNIKTVRISLDILKYKNRLPEAAGLIIVQDPRSDQMHQDLKEAFTLTKHLAPNLIASARDRGAIFATVTRLDGAFGLRHNQMQNPVQGGLAGLVKTAAIEWEDVCCHAIDIAPGWSDHRAIAPAIVREVMSPGPIEIGLDAESRCTLVLEPEPHPVGSINLTQNDVVIISGGARGVTAAATLELARYTGTKLVLLGRSPEPFAEPKWLSGLEREADIKKALLENEYRDKTALPVEIEKTYKNYMANREIAGNLKELKSTGADVYYFSADVRNFDNVQTIIDGIRKNHGPVTGIIHGAGVLQDRLIIDKSADQFERVYDTKVRGLDNLLKATRQDPLKYLVLFSSIAARLGNQGQVDYAVANEVLNKIAQTESFRRADCRVISINWGPWDGGMVTSSLKREFERSGIYLLPIHDAAKSMLYEMMAENYSPVEIVIGAEFTGAGPNYNRQLKRPALVKPAPIVKKHQLALSFEREIDIHQYPILQSHVIDGKPVVPLALMTEWFAHGALHENPGLVLHGLDDIRVMKGIRMEQDNKLIRLMAGKIHKNGEYYEVALELRDGKMSGQDILHAKAKAILGANLAVAPSYQFSKTMVAKAYTRKIKEVYDKVLFHGAQLHGIRKIVSCSSRGMVAHITTAPAPAEWMSAPLRNQWIADPLVLDCAFQMATVWCFEEKGVVSLPSYGASYRQYCDRFPSGGVTVVLEIEEVSNRRMRGNFTFLDTEDGIVARMNGYEAIMDASLFKAFKPQYRASA